MHSAAGKADTERADSLADVAADATSIAEIDDVPETDPLPQDDVHTAHFGRMEIPALSPYLIISAAACGFAIGLLCTVLCCQRRHRRARMATVPLNYRAGPPPAYKLHDDAGLQVAVVIGSPHSFAV